MKVEGSTITINDSVYNKMSIIPKGACEQEGTPTPDNPIPVKVVTGDNQVVVSNKNMFVPNLPATSTTFRGITVTRNNDEYTVTGTANGNATITLTNVLPKLLANETYTMFVKIIEGTIGGNIVVAVYNEDGTTSYNYFNLFVSRLSQSVSSNSNKTIRSLEVYVPNGTEVNYKFKLQLEKNSSATSYVPHQEQSTTLHNVPNLAGIGDYKDEIDVENKKIVKEVNKLNVKDLTWDLPETQPTDETLNMFRCTTVTDRLYTEEMSCLCNYLSYKGRAGGNNAGKDLGVGIWFLYNTQTQSKNIYIIIPKTIASNSTELINWATTNNVIIYYQLATPVEETITDTTLINDLNKLQELLSYDGTTNITVISEDTNAQMEVEVTYTSESDMCEKLLFIFNKMKDKLYHIIRSL